MRCFFGARFILCAQICSFCTACCINSLMSLASCLSFSCLNVLHAYSIASRFPFRSCLTGDICTVAFRCQDQTLSSYTADNVHHRFRADLQQMSTVQIHTCLTPSPTHHHHHHLSFKPTKLTVFATSQSIFY